jgi:hypothetical protein
MLFMTEDDGAADLRAVLFTTVESAVVDGQRLGVLAVGAEGFAAEDAAVDGNPVLAGGRYDEAARALDDGDVGAIAIGEDGTVCVSGRIASDDAAGAYPVLIGGEVDLTPAANLDNSAIMLKTDRYGRLQIAPALVVTETNLTLTSADTEYSHLLQTTTRQVRFQCRTAYDVRYAYTTGKVATPAAPYQTLKSGTVRAIDGIGVAAGATRTLYFASAQAGVIVEIEEWSLE